MADQPSALPAHLEFSLRHPVLSIVLAMLLVAGAGYGAGKMQFLTDYQVFFGENNPQLLEFKDIQDTYNRQDNVLMLFEIKGGPGVFTPQTMDLIERYTEKAWQLPYSSRVDSLSNYQHTYAEGDDLVVENLFEDAIDYTDEQIARVREIALNEPLIVDRLISADGKVTGINITFLIPQNQMGPTPEVAAATKALADEIEAERPDITVHRTGGVMINNQFLATSMEDAATLLPLVFLTMYVILYLLLRDFGAVIATFIVVTLTTVGAFGLAGWIGVDLTPPSVNSSIIVMTITVAACVHVLVQYAVGLARGMEKTDALRNAIRINFGPIFLTSATTAVGFLALNLSEVPPFRDLGNIVAFGVGISFVLSLTVLPAFMMLLPARVRASHADQSEWMGRYGAWVVKHHRRILPVSLLVVVLVSLGATQNIIFDQYSKYFDEDVPFRIATDFADESLAGLYNIQYSLDSGRENGVTDPAYLKTVEAFSQWLRQQPEVRNVNTFTDIMKRLNRNMHNNDPAYYRIPDDRELASQYMLLYELSLPYGLDLTNQVSMDKRATKLIASTPTMGTPHMIALQERATNWLRENAPPEMVRDGSSPSLMFTHIGKKNMISSIESAIVALTLISIMMFAALRSWKIGFISLIPNLVPILMGFGVWGLLIGKVGFSVSIVIGMALGIVVDDSVHFLSKYQRARRELGFPPGNAVGYAFGTVGKALTTTTVVLVVGFCILASSGFKINADIGLMTAITITFALLADFLLLPALLLVLDRDKGMHKTEPEGQPAGQASA